MFDRYVRWARAVFQQVLKIGLARIVQYITTGFVLSFIASRIWASWRTPSWSSLLPDRRQSWDARDYPALEYPKRQLRLLSLFPATGDTEIEGELYTTSFLDMPVYEAISYAWGNGDRTRTMTLNGKRILITENLWASLGSMRTATINRTVWVDAICINQSDVEEKSHQVGLMPYIYERAARVLVWLAESPHPDWVSDAWRLQWDPVWAVEESRKDWSATAHWLHYLVDQEYWKRCWIIQEIRQARDIHIYFGSHRRHGWMPWATFIRLAEQYRSREIVLPMIDRIFRLQSLRVAKYAGGYSLNELLDEFGDCFSSLQFDRIYPLLGITDDEPGRYFYPSYGKSVFQLYIDLLTFYEESEFHQERREIGIVRFAALVRAILSRQSSLSPKTRRVPGFGVDPGSWSYQFCRKFSGSFSKQTIESLAALLELASGFLYPHGEQRAPDEATWLPQQPESINDWLPVFEKGQSRLLMARGAFAGRVIKLGPAYGAYLADPGCVNRWIRDALEAISFNSSLRRQVVALNKKLAAILGDPGNYKFRNFMNFTSRDPSSYQKSRIYLGADLEENLIMGLAPCDTPEDARLVQFWNTDAALVVTPRQSEDESLSSKAIIGRVGIVRYGGEAGSVDWDKPSALEKFQPHSAASVQIPMAIDILTKLSFDTVVLPSTVGDFWFTLSFSPDL